MDLDNSMAPAIFAEAFSDLPNQIVHSRTVMAKMLDEAKI